jgi:hypothetical protein
VKHKDEPVVGSYSDAGVQVIAQAGVTQDQEKKTRWRKIHSRSAGGGGGL